MTIQSEVRAAILRACPARPPASVTPASTSELVRNTRGSSFSLCERSRTDPSYPRYPRLPVTSCRGHEPRAERDR